MDKFYIEDYISNLSYQDHITKKNTNISTENSEEHFHQLCSRIKDYFTQEWESEEGRSDDASDKLLQYQKMAIIGYEREVNYFKSKIKDYLKENNLLDHWFPRWYTDLTDAIFHENWGLAGIAQWKDLKDSSSAKIIGNRIYFMIGGKQVLQDQRISEDRLKQLITALLLRSPEIRMEDKASVYMLDGTRIQIFTKSLAKETAIIFRKYTVKQYTFEEQAAKGTIPKEIIPLLKAMVRFGPNVCFIGPVRSAKTTFLTTWQSYEDPSLEGIQVETDPEIPLHQIMPKAPIIQLVADGDKLKGIVKELMRADGDYLIMAEARDAVALKIALQVTKKGTRRVKSTFHTSDATDFCYDAAVEIVSEFGGDVFIQAVNVAKGYHYLIELVQLPHDKSQKRLKGIYELRYDKHQFKVSVHQICRYDFMQDDWTYCYDVGPEVEEIAIQEDYQAFLAFKNVLQRLAEDKPMQGEHITIPTFMNVMNMKRA